MESAASLWPWGRTIPGECWGWSLGEGVSLEQSAVLHMLLCPGPILHPVTCVRAEELGSQQKCHSDRALCFPGPSWTRWSTGRVSWPWST